MAGLHPPKVAGKLVPVFPAAELAHLQAACAGRGFAERRDAAIIAVLTASGIRLSELAGIRCRPDDPRHSDLDLWQREVTVHGKGGKPRIVKISYDAARAVDRYLRARARHPQEILADDNAAVIASAVTAWKRACAGHRSLKICESFQSAASGAGRTWKQCSLASGLRRTCRRRPRRRRRPRQDLHGSDRRPAPLTAPRRARRRGPAQIYAHCIDGHATAANQRIAEALGTRDTEQDLGDEGDGDMEQAS